MNQLAPLVLYCCSYSKDLKRVERLLHSLKRHNIDKLDVYISVPEKDIHLFKDLLSSHRFTLINEKDILLTNPKINQDKLYSQRGWIQQQVIKSEFWRLNISENYLVLDSDCVFIKDFSLISVKRCDDNKSLNKGISFSGTDI